MDEKLSLSTFLKSSIESPTPGPSRCSSPSTSSTSSVKTYVTLKEILDSNEEGKLFANSQKDSTLTDKTRQILIDLICLYFIHNDIYMSTSHCLHLADDILEHFPSEEKELYFRHQQNKAPKGKLHIKYQNLLRKLRDGGLKPKRQKKNTSGSFSSGGFTNIDFHSEVDAMEHINWIDDEKSSWRELKERWPKCVQFRMNFILRESQTTTEIIQRFPSYKEPLGYKLVYKFTVL
ncbi:unnamed protein product [Brassicogethes aeneus]|uniref:Uncharacterized protein n=1 Tax=Brassicogethes aeneus TaxID=1431903 RepID=A0A9P0BH83_BRAAE|nr:unnamed protein product [Brassicogethes aeneus]